MPEVKPLTTYPQTGSYSPDLDFFVILKGGDAGPREGPLLLTANALQVTGTGAPGSGGNVFSVFGRIGAILAAAGDYAADQIDYDNGSSGLSAANAQDAIDELAAGGGGGLPSTAGASEGYQAILDGELNPSWGPPLVESVFGRSGAIGPMAGDYDAGQIAETSTKKILTDVERTKLAGLSDAWQTGGTTGQVWAKASNTDADCSWQDAGTGTGGAPARIDLMPLFTPAASTPPTCRYVSGTRVWAFSNTTADELRAQFEWPSGTGSPTLRLLMSGDVNTGNVKMLAFVMAVTAGDAASIITDSFDAANSDTEAVPGTAGYSFLLEIPLSNLDGGDAGDYIRLKLVRDNTVGSNSAGAVIVHTATIVWA